ncbi:MAG: AfsR/SARP family transcriptional regulator, partial [Actinobacteria bacterium]|nr:AfsR/SARP family transcriptional regulator [Actinomycetota bacterium]
MAVARTRGATSASSPRLSSSGGGRAASAQRTGAASFLGREQELAELSALLKEARLITLTGAPGIGKSRLGVELARKGARRYPGGRQVVELAPVARDLDVPRAVAAALSVQEVAGQSLTELLVARLSGRRSLLGLDNCEHLLEGCRELIEALLQGCPELRVVATSREPLGLASEHLWQLAPLAVPAPEQETSLKSLTDYAAVQLFLERAAAVQPGFALNAYVAPAVVEICRRLDGIPLAIELAAARVDSLTPREIASRLDERFTLLSKRGPGPLAHHHQTLQAALDWSHELLSGPERALLRRLSVFAGSFDIEAAEAVCPAGELGAHEVGGLLGELVSKSLVVARSGSLPMERYRLLETIRAYAGEKLTQVEEATALRTGHVRHYLQLAERAEPELTGSDQAAWFERLETERGNLRAAIEWSLSQGEA